MTRVTVYSATGEGWAQLFNEFTHPSLAKEYQEKMQKLYRDAGVKVFVKMDIVK